jgi:hypothetical protein
VYSLRVCFTALREVAGLRTGRGKNASMICGVRLRKTESFRAICISLRLGGRSKHGKGGLEEGCNLLVGPVMRESVQEKGGN